VFQPRSPPLMMMGDEGEGRPQADKEGENRTVFWNGGRRYKGEWHRNKKHGAHICIASLEQTPLLAASHAGTLGHEVPARVAPAGRRLCMVEPFQSTHLFLVGSPVLVRLVSGVGAASFRRLIPTTVGLHACTPKHLHMDFLGNPCSPRRVTDCVELGRRHRARHAVLQER
jgi:hypothetical protein